MADLIQKFELGLNYRAGNIDGLCRSIDKMMSDSLLREKMSEKAVLFFREYGNAG
jgi:hypothetical protein